MHSGFSSLRNEMTMCIRERVDVRPWSAALAGDIARIAEIWNEGRGRFGNGGPYLCGAFSLADAFYAPVAFRFRTYGVTLESPAGDYLHAMLAYPSCCASGRMQAGGKPRSSPPTSPHSLPRQALP
jgi:glutathione S-transferase